MQLCLRLDGDTLSFDPRFATRPLLHFVRLLAHIPLLCVSDSFLLPSMRMANLRFNPYLAVILAVSLVLASGCLTPEEKRDRKMQATLRMHLTALPNQTELREPVIIAGATIYVEKAFFLDERSLNSAAIVDSPGGGYSIRLEFNDHGRITLESTTASYPGRQIAIFTQFGAGQLDKGSWLAAPRIPRRISDGVIVFSPGVSREAAEDIVLGLNNVAEEQKKLLSDW
jgi:hypothetical protein